MIVVICLQISIFDLLTTTFKKKSGARHRLWFAYKLVSLTYWQQHHYYLHLLCCVVICLQISIFDLLTTTDKCSKNMYTWLWFAYKLVSLTYWQQPTVSYQTDSSVVICLQISIFDLLTTTGSPLPVPGVGCDLLTN